ncbi:MAG: discoidin domain-containing protein [Gammaproteobacteria bacterium]|nr:discoidin domain-containing protein [Gammaproteobacteria bacterium]
MPSRLRVLLLAVVAAGLTTAEEAPETWLRPGPNLAVGADYTLAPAPSYALCRDDGDGVQLTDGQYTSGYFWTTASTVGWGAGHEPLITLDLGRPQAIAGLSYHTAAGRAGVAWPRRIALFVSDDGRQWHPAGDLVALDRQRGGAPPTEFDTYRFWTGALRTHGRFVALAIQPDGAYTFIDELEVYGGDPAWLAEPLAGPGLDGLEAARLQRRAVADVEAQVETLRTRLGDVPAAPRPGLQTALDEAAAGLEQLVPPPPDRAELPFGQAHLAVLAVNAAIGRAMGHEGLELWQSNKWDPLEMISLPPQPRVPPRLDYALLRGEVRGEVLNLTNFGHEALRLACRVEGLPAATATIRQAVWTAVRDAPPMASALPVLNGPLVLEPGLTRQLWIAVDAATLPAGDLTGRLVLEGGPDGTVTVPLTVHVPRWRCRHSSRWPWADGTTRTARTAA